MQLAPPLLRLASLARGEPRRRLDGGVWGWAAPPWRERGSTKKEDMMSLIRRLKKKCFKGINHGIFHLSVTGFKSQLRTIVIESRYHLTAIQWPMWNELVVSVQFLMDRCPHHKNHHHNWHPSWQSQMRGQGLNGHGD